MNKSLQILIYTSWIFLSNPVVAQIPDSVFYQVINGINEFRNQLLHDTARIHRLAHIASKLNDPNSALTPIRILTGINTTAKFCNYQAVSQAKTSMERKLNKTIEKYNLTDEDLQFLKSISPYMFLWEYGLLEEEYPFKLNPAAFLVIELMACFFDSEENIAEIGAGDGFFALLLQKIYKGKLITITELNEEFIKNLHQSNFSTFTDSDEGVIEILQGDIYITNLVNTYNKIILRNTFHHLEHPEQILNDINKHLKDDGQLIIIEVFKDNSKDYQYLPGNYQCNIKWKESDFIEFMTSLNFRIELTIDAGPRKIMIYQKK